MNASYKFPEPKTPSQSSYVESIQKNVLTICTGKAGSGKTFLAIAEAVKLIQSSGAARKGKGRFKKLIVIRPYIPSNTGEKLGALPGTLDEKVAPYAASIKDNLSQIISNPAVVTQIMNEMLEFTVLSTCRGRSFTNCIVLVEEGQNVPTNGGAMKMLLTRIGKNCKMIIAGDLDQCDIDSQRSSLPMAMNILEDMKDVGIVEMEGYEDVQRSPLVRNILRRFDENNQWPNE
jgi:phosphate starvation-inducible PhoH-like protein